MSRLLHEVIFPSFLLLGKLRKDSKSPTERSKSEAVSGETKGKPEKQAGLDLNTTPPWPSSDSRSCYPGLFGLCLSLVPRAAQLRTGIGGDGL